MRYILAILVFLVPLSAFAQDDDNAAQRMVDQDAQYKQQLQIDDIQRQQMQQRMEYQPPTQPQVQYVPVYGNGSEPTQ